MDYSKPLLTREAVAARLCISLRLLDRLIATGTIPAPKQIGSRRYYWHPLAWDAWERQVFDIPAIEETRTSLDATAPSSESVRVEEPALSTGGKIPVEATSGTSRLRRGRNAESPRARARANVERLNQEISKMPGQA